MFVAFDGTETHAEAVAIKDGKFVYVGDEAGIAGWIGDTTTVVDCHRKSVLPGLADAHMHLAHSAELSRCSKPCLKVKRYLRKIEEVKR